MAWFEYCSKEDHDQSALQFQLRFPVVARYSKQILPKGWNVHLMTHKFMAIRLGFLVATLVTEVMVTKERTGVGLNWSTAALVLAKATHREKMGIGTSEAEQEDPAPMVTLVGDPLSEKEPPCEPPSTQGDAEETRLRQIFEGEDDGGWNDLRDEAAKLLDVR